MKALRIKADGRDIYKKRFEISEKTKLAFKSFIYGAIVMYVVLHCFM